jgi:hypothetical protein
VSTFSTTPLVLSAVINDDVKSVCLTHLYRLPLQACILETSLASSMSDTQSSSFPGGHCGGVSAGFIFGGPFHNRDMPMPSVLGQKRRRMVHIYTFV